MLNVKFRLNSALVELGYPVRLRAMDISPLRGEGDCPALPFPSIQSCHSSDYTILYSNMSQMVCMSGVCRDGRVVVFLFWVKYLSQLLEYHVEWSSA